MFGFLFAVSCLVFISTITWLSYKLSESKNLNPFLHGIIGFILAFIPPFALGFIAYLAFKDEVQASA